MTNLKTRIFIISGLYVGIFLFFTCVFLILLHFPFLTSQRVLFYRGISLLIATFFIITAFIVFISRKYLKEYIQSMVAALMIAASLNLTFFILFPVTFDRSVTMFILEDLRNRNASTCEGLSKQDIRQNLVGTYILANDAVDKRMTEQSIISMVTGNDQCYVLTDRAKQFLQFSKVIKELYNIK